MANMQYVLMDLGPYAEILGKPATNFKMMITGEPGAGKTFLLLNFANWFAKNIGSVLFISGEEFESPALSEKLKKIGDLSSNLRFGKDISALSNYHYDLVIIDSIQSFKLTPDDFKKLTEKYDISAFILILQKTKDGKFKGDKYWEHDVDISANIFVDGNNRLINIKKNRYGELLTKKIVFKK